MTWEKDPLLNQTSYGYPTNQATITDPNSNVTTQNFDTSGRVTSEVDPLSNSESYTWDSDHNRTSVTDRRGNTGSYGYDSAGNVTSVTDPLTHYTTVTYNSKHRPLILTSPLGNQVVNTYDTTLNWRLTQTQRKNSGGTVLSTTTYTYNTDGTVATKVDSNSRVTSWTVNTLGARTGRTDALSRTTTYTLDNWLRVITHTYPNSSTQTFSYDANGNKTGWTDAQGTWSRTYDTANRMTAEKLNTVTRFSYAYDATG